MKKIISILLTIFISISVTGCTSEEKTLIEKTEVTESVQEYDVKDNDNKEAVTNEKSDEETDELTNIDKTNIYYWVNFLNKDGSVISRKQYKYGSVPETPENPTYSDGVYNYKFIGWNNSIRTVEGTQTYTAEYKIIGYIDINSEQEENNSVTPAENNEGNKKVNACVFDGNIDSYNNCLEGERTTLENKIKYANSERDNLVKTWDDAQSRYESANENEKSSILSEINEIQTKISDLDDYIEDLSNELYLIKQNLNLYYDIKLLTNNTEFINPMPGSKVGAGVPYLDDGSKHLGVDYNGVSYGTCIYAPSDGIIISIVNGCTKDRGNNFGNSCPYGTSEQGNGLSYMGNQARFITSVNGHVYGFIFANMMSNSVHETGNIKVGEVIGRIGSSGNSTGAHCHIEMFYLGDGESDDLNYYIEKYGNSNGFKTVYTPNSFCANNGGNAPCRLDARNYLGIKNPELIFDFYE